MPDDSTSRPATIVEAYGSPVMLPGDEQAVVFLSRHPGATGVSLRPGTGQFHVDKTTGRVKALKENPFRAQADGRGAQDFLEDVRQKVRGH